MKRSYTRTEREEAARFLSCLASEETATGQGFVSDLAEHFEVSPRALKLARAAYGRTPYTDAGGHHIPWHEQMAEAEAWIRTGWSP